MELAEIFTLAAQVAQAFNVPLFSDAELSLPDFREIPRPIFTTVHLMLEPVHPAYRHLSGKVLTLRRVVHRGKKIWLKGDEAVLELVFGPTSGISLLDISGARLRLKANTQSLFFSGDVVVSDVISLNVSPSVTSATTQQTPDVFYEYLQASATPLKTLLTQQLKVFSGVGSYTANEALFASRLHPRSPASTVDQTEALVLLSNLRKIVERSVELGGSTTRNVPFRDVYGNAGAFQAEFRIQYAKVCPRCGGAVHKRGSPADYFCPTCQPLKVERKMSA